MEMGPGESSAPPPGSRGQMGQAPPIPLPVVGGSCGPPRPPPCPRHCLKPKIVASGQAPPTPAGSTPPAWEGGGSLQGWPRPLPTWESSFFKVLQEGSHFKCPSERTLLAPELGCPGTEPGPPGRHRGTEGPAPALCPPPFLWLSLPGAPAGRASRASGRSGGGGGCRRRIPGLGTALPLPPGRTPATTEPTPIRRLLRGPARLPGPPPLYPHDVLLPSRSGPAGPPGQQQQGRPQHREPGRLLRRGPLWSGAGHPPRLTGEPCCPFLSP